MRREPHVRFREGGGVKLLSATRPVSGRTGVTDQKVVEPKTPHYTVMNSALVPGHAELIEQERQIIRRLADSDAER